MLEVARELIRRAPLTAASLMTLRHLSTSTSDALRVATASQDVIASPPAPVVRLDEVLALSLVGLDEFFADRLGDAGFLSRLWGVGNHFHEAVLFSGLARH